MLPEEDEPAVVPRAVVADVGCEERFDVGEFGVPEREVTDQPLPVGPDVVVFGVFGEHAGEEGEFGGGERGEMGHERLAVMPESLGRRAFDAKNNWSRKGVSPYLVVLQVS